MVWALEFKNWILRLEYTYRSEMRGESPFQHLRASSIINSYYLPVNNLACILITKPPFLLINNKY